jgi:hypothetical protein
MQQTLLAICCLRLKQENEPVGDEISGTGCPQRPRRTGRLRRRGQHGVAQPPHHEHPAGPGDLSSRRGLHPNPRRGRPSAWSGAVAAASRFRLLGREFYFHFSIEIEMEKVGIRSLAVECVLGAKRVQGWDVFEAWHQTSNRDHRFISPWS